MNLITKKMLPLEESELAQVRLECSEYKERGSLAVLSETLPEILSRDWLNPKLMERVRASEHSSAVNPNAWREHLERQCEGILEEVFKESIIGAYAGDRVFTLFLWRSSLASLYQLLFMNFDHCHYFHLDMKRREKGDDLVAEVEMKLEEKDEELLRTFGGNDFFLIVDPMLATGTSIMHCLEQLKYSIPLERIVIACVAAAPEGVCNILRNYPGVKIFTATLHDYLDRSGYIHPGLGDAGDKFWNSLPGISYFEEARVCFSDAQWAHLEKLFAK